MQKPTFFPKYTVADIPGETNDEIYNYLKEVFPEGKGNELNLLIGSTSGIHGSYTTLNDLEEREDDTFPRDHIESFTLLIIQPRVCRLQCGTVGIRSQADIDYLRTLIRSSLIALEESQKENI